MLYNFLKLSIPIFIVLIIIEIYIPSTANSQGIDCRLKNCTVEDLKSVLSPKRYRDITPINESTRPIPPVIQLNVLFHTNSAVIRPEFYDEIDKLGQVLASPDLKKTHLKIDGHTDNTGENSYNKELSRHRAHSVKQYLTQHFSINPSRLVVEGHGKDTPLTSNDTSEGRQKNRRVEVRPLSEETPNSR